MAKTVFRPGEAKQVEDKVMLPLVKDYAPVEEVVDIQNDDGHANYIGGDVGGDINNGQDNSAKTAGQETPEEITE